MSQLESFELQVPPQDVLKGEGPEIADVRKIPHSGATRIHADFTASQRSEGLNSPSVTIEKLEYQLASLTFFVNKKKVGEWNYFSLPIRKIGLPHEAQVPFTANRPFFSLICFGFLISLFFFFSKTQ
jgi:hypothetical protein